jgi:bifunctional enzyme CysN/CysC
LRVGDEVRVLPRGQRSRVERIVSFDGDLPQTRAGEAPVITLTSEIDVSRGDVLASLDAELQTGARVGAHVFWTVEAPMRVGQRYVLKLGAFETQAVVAAFHHAVDVNTYAPAVLDELPMNGVGLVTLSLDRPAVFADYARNRELGGFILIDRLTNDTVAIGLVDQAAANAVQGARPGALARFIEQRIGVAGTERRAHIVQRASVDAASAVPLVAAVYVASGSVVAGLAVAALDLAMRPLIRLYGRRLAKRWRARNDNLNADGGGI